ncbi:actin-related protein 2/3 complex subunit 5-like protein isoform X2 [Lathamus discolor]|uniref:actin-related protein 2/3 complex subunit 5-like protein isoform X2 n=1 Tax=Lathamus discolor TaxID=678569 RepID=UPI0032B805C1
MSFSRVSGCRRAIPAAPGGKRLAPGGFPFPLVSFKGNFSSKVPARCCDGVVCPVTARFTWIPWPEGLFFPVPASPGVVLFSLDAGSKRTDLLQRWGLYIKIIVLTFSRRCVFVPHRDVPSSPAPSIHPSLHPRGGYRRLGPPRVPPPLPGAGLARSFRFRGGCGSGSGSGAGRGGGMARSTLSSRFRRLDIDQYDENRFVEEPEEAAAAEPDAGPEVEALLRGRAASLPHRHPEQPRQHEEPGHEGAGPGNHA